MKRNLAAAVAVALAASAAPADAVMLSARGTGQVLIYPYYTVNHFQTLLSVVNATANGKAVKVRFREGYDGRDVATFNVYLAPFDTWVGAVFDTSPDGSGGAAIATNDNSCTVPAFDKTFFPNGPAVLAFSNKNYSQGDYGTPTGTDTGPTDLKRTREGFFEIIEMGAIVDQTTNSPKTLEAISAVNGVPQNCAQVQGAWASGGYWAANAQTDMTAPNGGLFGAAGIVDVGEGTLYAYDATAIDGFSDVVQHTAPGDTKPNLSTAVTDSAHQITSAYLVIDPAYTGLKTPVVKADYPAGAQGVDAISALLSANDVDNEYITDPKLGAATDFLVTFPTKQFYVDPGIVGLWVDSYIQPFEEVFGGGRRFTTNNGVRTATTGPVDPGESCASVDFGYTDREAATQAPNCDGLCPVIPGNYVCYEAAVLTFSQSEVQPGVPSHVLRSTLAQDVPASYINGWMDLYFPDGFEETRAALDSRVFHGLPVVGFSAINYINANVTPGVLSNYSGAYPHRTDVDTFCFSTCP